jgi:hypothetical protein
MKQRTNALRPPAVVFKETANGENVKVVQELMRHASSRFTLEIYTQAKAKAKREAQQRIVEMMLPEEGLEEIRLQRKEPPETLGG